VARLATYLGTAAAVPVLRRKLAGTESRVRLPGGPVIPIAAVVLTIGLAASATITNLIAAGAALTVGLLIFVFRRPMSSKRGADATRGPR
jgi:amino acid transporter